MITTLAGADLEYGESLAAECVVCHNQNSADRGVPNISGLLAVAFASTLTESQQASRKMAETIIAHQTGSLTERAYNRTDFLEQRREMMEAWEIYLSK